MCCLYIKARQKACHGSLIDHLLCFQLLLDACSDRLGLRALAQQRGGHFGSLGDGALGYVRWRVQTYRHRPIA